MTAQVTLSDFGAFYERTYATAYRTAYAIIGEASLAGDAVQDAYLSAFRGRARFRGDGSAETWLIRIVVNTAISATRRRRVGWVVPLALDLAAPGNEAQRSVERISMIAALQEVPPRERAAMVLRFYLDYDYVTIARCLGTSTGTVGSWLSRGIDRLRPVLERSADISSQPRRLEGRDDA